MLSLLEVNKVDNWCSFKNKLELYSKEMVFSSSLSGCFSSNENLSDFQAGKGSTAYYLRRNSSNISGECDGKDKVKSLIPPAIVSKMPKVVLI